MELLKKSLQIYNIFWPIEDFLYVLQLEDYYSEFYFRRIWRFFLRRNIAKRGKLINTPRIKILRILYFFLFALILSLVIWLCNNVSMIFVALGVICLYSVLTPLTVGILNWTTAPFNLMIKNRLKKEVHRRFIEEGKVKSICIVGSYGKTTVRNLLREVLQYNFNILTPEGNINTCAGLALWYKKKFRKTSNLILFETDGYKKGEIYDAAYLFEPHYVIITALGDQHLMRLGSRKVLAETLLEAVKASKSTAKVLLTSETYEKIIELVGKTTFESALESRTLIKVESTQDMLSDLVLNCSLELKVDKSIAEDVIQNTRKPDRRGDIKKLYGYEVLDYSYNISFETARYAIESAKEYSTTNGKKIVAITAGIPELGKENSDGNIRLGKLLDEHCERIYIIKSILYKDILKGISKSEKITFKEDLKSVWESILKDVDPHLYVILFLPELDDLNY